MAKTEGTYIQVVYKNVFGYISTNSWPFFMIQRPTIREKCAWVRSNTWQDERPVATDLDRFFFGFSIFWQTLQLATEKIQNLCNRNWWSGLFQLGSVWFWSFFQSSELDLRTLIKALGPNLHVSAIKSTIKGCAGSPNHNHQNCCLCLSTTVTVSIAMVPQFALPWPRIEPAATSSQLIGGVRVASSATIQQWFKIRYKDDLKILFLPESLLNRV